MEDASAGAGKCYFGAVRRLAGREGREWMTNAELGIIQIAIDRLPLSQPHQVCVFCLAGQQPFWDEATCLWEHRIGVDSGIGCRQGANGAKGGKGYG